MEMTCRNTPPCNDASSDLGRWWKRRTCVRECTMANINAPLLQIIQNHAIGGITGEHTEQLHIGAQQTQGRTNIRGSSAALKHSILGAAPVALEVDLIHGGHVVHLRAADA